MAEQIRSGLRELQRIFGKENVTEETNTYVIQGGSFIDFPFEESVGEGMKSRRQQALDEIIEPFEELKNQFKKAGVEINFIMRDPSNGGVTYCSFHCNKSLIEQPTAVRVLSQFSKQALEASHEQARRAVSTTHRETEILERFNKFLGPTRWKLIDTEAGRAIATFQAVTDAEAVITKLAELFDTDTGVTPDGPGNVILPLKLLNDIKPEKLSDKIRGLNLDTELHPYYPERGTRLR